MHEVRLGGVRAGAIALVATLTLVPSWFAAAHAAAAQGSGGHEAAGPPPAAGHFSLIAVPHGTEVQAEEISDSGTVVGCYQAATSERAFIDKHGKISTFADPAITGKHGVTCALGIDDAGVIVGYYTSAGSAAHGFVDRNGRFTTITAPAAGKRFPDGTFADGINSSGVIVGYYSYGRHLSQHGFVLKNGKFAAVRFPLSRHSHPLATVLDGIADDGTISGAYIDAKRHDHSFLERADKFTTIAVPHGIQTDVFCISEHGGLAVGTFQPTGEASGTMIGFTYRAGVYRSLRDPSAPQHTDPQCGNNAGFVVGYLTGANGVPTHGFLFTPAKG
jgi:hypothetical protein